LNAALEKATNRPSPLSDARGFRKDVLEAAIA
jgi:hypothetical protein